MICDAGDVAIVPFPFVEMTVHKRRPALVLSRRAFNEDNGSTILAMITSAKRSAWPSDVLLTDVAAAGLRQNCYVRWKVFTLPNNLLQRLAGTLSLRDSKRVHEASGGIFG